jgi:phospholipase C
MTKEPDPPAALAQIKHIVVLMMENRSFDMMLGYLSLNGRTDVEGLRPDMKNVVDGRPYPIHNLDRYQLEDWEDPPHDGDPVATQVSDREGGFVRAFIDTRDPEHQQAARDQEKSVVMGYYDGDDLPVYDFLAKNFCICDHWFASVAGATWPNRCYAVAGESDGRKDNRKLFARYDFPLYFLPAFVRHLERKQWRWYSGVFADVEPASVRLIDPLYFFKPGKNFALFDRAEPGSGQGSFLDDARSGNLPDVAWIDPDFYVSGRKNDDHPPSHVHAGQLLVREVCNAVMEGPAWEETLLIITYDEHGGFFDHVEPPEAPDDRPEFRRYGLRVPAFIIGPQVKAGSVRHEIFDHTSIIKTVLERFAPASTEDMGTRVAKAESVAAALDPKLSRDPMTIPDFSQLADARTREIPEVPTPNFEVLTRRGHGGVAPEDVDALLGPRARGLPGEEPELNDLQRGMLAAGAELRIADED